MSNTCGVKINEAKLKHTGNWTCKLLNSDGVTETQKIFVVQIASTYYFLQNLLAVYLIYLFII